MTDRVRAKKHLGQHFLKEPHFAQKIAQTLDGVAVNKVLEIGPGMGVLTQYLLPNPAFETWVCEIDTESVAYLEKHYPDLAPRILATDFLTINLKQLFDGESFAIIGNFPYNISSQILFQVWEHHEVVPFFAGMFQKEVAARVCAPPGSKVYGILSVLLQRLYEVEYLFTVPPGAFNPPPQVQSGVMRMRRRDDLPPLEHPKAFKMLVKQAFNQRRKTLRNALKGITFETDAHIGHLLDKRAEQLHFTDFELLTKAIKK